MNKHQLKTEATRGKLLKASRKIFARDGFEAAKIDEIAALAGYTRGAFYAHFKSKEDLFFALLEQQSFQHAEEFKTLAAQATTEEDRLAAIREYYARKAADPQWAILTFEFKLFALRHPRLRAKLAERHRLIRSNIRLQGVPKFGHSQKELKRIILEVLLNGLILETTYDPTRLPPDTIQDTLGRLFDLILQSNTL